MSNYKTNVFDFTVKRRTSDHVHDDGPERGAIQRIEVGATRSKHRKTSDARYTVVYSVNDGVAKVAAVEPTAREHSDPAVKPAHLAAVLEETDALVQSSVPEVEAVKAFSHSLREERPGPATAVQANVQPEPVYDSLEDAAEDDDGLSPSVSNARDDAATGGGIAGTDYPEDFAGEGGRGESGDGA